MSFPSACRTITTMSPLIPCHKWKSMAIAPYVLWNLVFFAQQMPISLAISTSLLAEMLQFSWWNPYRQGTAVATRCCACACILGLRGAGWGFSQCQFIYPMSTDDKSINPVIRVMFDDSEHECLTCLYGYNIYIDIYIYVHKYTVYIYR